MLYIVECLFQIDMETANGNNEAICLELLGVLRRCFMQQADVRLCLYEGKAVTIMEFNSSAATERLKRNMMQASFSFNSIFLDILKSQMDKHTLLLNKTLFNNHMFCSCFASSKWPSRLLCLYLMVEICTISRKCHDVVSPGTIWSHHIEKHFFNDVSLTWHSLLFHSCCFTCRTSIPLLKQCFRLSSCFLLVLVDISHIAAISPIGEMHSQLNGLLTVTLQTCNWELILPCVITGSVLY